MLYLHLQMWLRMASDEEREQLASACETSIEYFYQIAGGHRAGSGRLIRKIEEESHRLTPNRIVSRKIMRPDIFGPPPAAECLIQLLGVPAVRRSKRLVH